MSAIRFTLTLTLVDGADADTVADAVLDVLFGASDDELVGVESIDGCEVGA